MRTAILLLAVAALGAVAWLALRDEGGLEALDPAPPLQAGEEGRGAGIDAPAGVPDLQVVPTTHYPRLAVLDADGSLPPPSEDAMRRRQEFEPPGPEDVETLNGREMVEAIQEAVYVRVRAARDLKHLEALDGRLFLDRGDLGVRGVVEVLRSEGYVVEDHGHCIVIGRE